MGLLSSTQMESFFRFETSGRLIDRNLESDNRYEFGSTGCGNPHLGYKNQTSIKLFNSFPKLNVTTLVRVK